MTASWATPDRIRSRGLPGLGLTVPEARPAAVRAETATDEAVRSRTTAEPETTESTLPIRPASSSPSPWAAITGWPMRIPDEEPLLMVILAYQSVGERVTTRAVTGR